MHPLPETLRRHVEDGTVPGAVGLVARGADVEVAAAGAADTEGTAPMARDTLFRIASLTKPVTAAALLMLVDEGLIGLEDPVADWLPELARPLVVRTPSGPVDDVVPARRPVTMEDVLTSRTGWGLHADASLPAVRALNAIQKNPLAMQDRPDPDTWLAELARVPMLHHPGDAWLYGTSSTLQGLLVARVSGRPLPEFLAERVFAPLGMRDTAFAVPAAERHRFTSLYRPGEDGGLVLVDAPDGEWSSVPLFASGAGGLVSTADDWLAFARMLLNGGTADGHRLLRPGSVARMTTDHLTADQRAAGTLFLEGQGWGYGGAVDVARTDPWRVPGRYGWIGGTGTTAHLVPSTGTVTILLSQVCMTDPAPNRLMRDFWRATG
ncbi:serine hydrolase domain-containing protein [Streptomyces sp. NPDC047017]|uniref:serine hydrolase domain-containing protein n=1 Tax=Streptomyces sp. NPDC047017 TaxID=3155024 RepID=UPI0033C159D8